MTKRIENETREQPRLRLAPQTIRPELTTLPLRDLGYVEGRRVHVLPAWGIPVNDGISELLTRVAHDRPEVDAVVMGSLRAPRALRAAVADEPTLYCACPEADDTPSGWALPVGETALAEASQLLHELAWGPFSEEAALALAGFWTSKRDVGTDVVIVLARLSDGASRRVA